MAKMSNIECLTNLVNWMYKINIYRGIKCKMQQMCTSELYYYQKIKIKQIM